jgi:hypothetical protein
MAHRLPPRSPQTFRSSNEDWHGSPLANQARERYQAAEQLWSLAEEHRRRAVALEAEARAEETLGDHLARQAVRRREEIRPEHRVLPWVGRATQEQAWAEAAQAARALHQAEEAVEAEAYRKEMAAAEAHHKAQAQGLLRPHQRMQVHFRWVTGL